MYRFGSRVILLLGLLLGLGTFAVVSAPTPAQAAAEPFNAAQCEGETTYDPTAVGTGSVRDLTRVWGQRLEDYNAGKTVLLYGSYGDSRGTPNCVLRSTPTGDVVEWMYCTDRTANTCSVTNSEGALTQQGTKVGSLEYKDGNARISADQETVINHILHNDLTVTGLPGQGPTGATESSDADSATRNVKQFLVWCVSDRASFSGVVSGVYGPWCDENMGAEKQAEILAGIPDDATLSMSSGQTVTDEGQQLVFTLSTNLLQRPIALNASSGTLTLCDPSVGTLQDDELVITTGERNEAVDVELCLDGAAVGEAGVTADAKALDTSHVKWVQSAGTVGGKACQVYSIASGAEGIPVAARAFSTVKAVDVPEEPTEGPEESEGPEEPAESEPAETDESAPAEETETTTGDDAGQSTDDDTQNDTQNTAGVLPDTGAGGPLTVALIAGIALLLAGCGTLVAVRRRTTNG